MNSRGSILLFTLIFGTVAISLLVVGLTGFAISEHRAAIARADRELAVQIAEAGVNYYEWHLQRDPLDFTDGGAAQPNTHPYYDKNGVLLGSFTLQITPPATGTSVIEINSVGETAAGAKARAEVKARFGMSALTDYAFLAASNVWIGEDETVHGKFHSNGGIRFDGTGDAAITSAVPSYYCETAHGCNHVLKPGIWGAGEPQSLWEYPVPQIDFGALTSNLADIKTKAQANGLYLSSSGNYGWALTFNADATVTARKVTAVDCYSGMDIDGTTASRCLDPKTYGAATNYNMPVNQFIYVEDTVWVSGVVNGRVTLGAGPNKSVVILNNIVYLAKNGAHSLVLLAPKDVLLPYKSPDNLEINAVLIAQNGGVKRYYFSSGSYAIRNSIITYGSLMSNGMWTWTWVNISGAVLSGYRYNTANYDTNLTYHPPAGLPLGTEYQLLNWKIER